MNFSEVRKTFSEYLNNNSLCKSIIRISDILAIIVTILFLLTQFISLGTIIPALLSYLVLIIPFFCLASKSNLGLLCIFGSQTLTNFILLTRSLIKNHAFSWYGLFGILLWGTLTFLVVVSISNHGMGDSPIMQNIQKTMSSKSTTVRVCPFCGATEENPKATFCSTCGQKLDDNQSPEKNITEKSVVQTITTDQKISESTISNNKIVCPKCGKEMDSNNIFCPVCGTKIK